MMLVDSHVHLDFPAFDHDREAVVARARAAGVAAFVVPGTKRGRWERVRETAARHDGAFPAYGIHPWFLDRHGPEDLEELERWLAREPAVAVGECGLDYWLPAADEALQREFFSAQLRLAKHHHLPVIVHARKSLDQVTREIRAAGCERGVIHSFSGSLQQAEKVIDRGFLLGLGGVVTHPRARRLRSLVPALPLESLLLETDAPDQPGAAHRGKRNEPAWLTEVLETVAELRREPAEEIAAVTSANARRLFGLPP